MNDFWDEVLRQDAGIDESPDPTWKWNFKWAYNAETGETDIWRVQGGTDGRPTHRQEVEKRWGRPARVQDGDTMGLATYIPAEKKYDGTVMAPAEVRLQTYYQMPTPPSVIEWFQKNFPGASIRDAVIVPSKTQIFGRKTAEWDPTPYEPDDLIFKWIWNLEKGLLIWETEGVDGMPFHDMKCMREWGRLTDASDTLGYAFVDVPERGAITVESYDAMPTDPKAFAMVKAQLAEWYPHDQIINGNEPEKHEFGGSPADFHGAAVKWAWEHLGQTVPGQSQNDSEATIGVWGGLTRLFQKKPVWEKTADADMEGCMVALFVPEEAGNKLKIRGGEPVENMHITLLYFADKADERDDWDEVRKLVEQIANQSPPMTGKVSGYGVFGSDEGDVLWASPSVVGLAELRHKLYEACEDAGFHVNEEHDWAPHITLKYDHKGKLPKTSDEIELEFEELSFAQGDDHDDFKMKGHLEKTTAAAFQPGDQVAIAQDPEGRHIKPYVGRVLRVYRDPINREWCAVIQWNYPDPDKTNPNYTSALPVSNLVPFQRQMDLDLGWKYASGEPVKLDIAYHISGTQNRDNIAKHGLNWEKGNPELLLQNDDAWNGEWPRGQYFFVDKDEALGTASSEDDVYEVDLRGIPVYPDPYHTHVWNHETGGYDPNDKLVAVYTTQPIPPDRVHLIEPGDFVRSEQWTSKVAADDYLDWSGWEGAHRFVTDGKELLTSPETEPINESAWRDSKLLDKFRSFYPDAKGFAQGWTVPTTDKLGIGIWAPAAGHGDEHEPGIHDIIKVVEKQFGKPAHFITNPDHLSDEKMYAPSVRAEWQEL